jgi:hypothetical protein
MFRGLQGKVMDGVKDGLSLYGSYKAFGIADAIVASTIGFPAIIRKPAVGLVLATLLQKFVGGRVGKYAVAVAFEQTIASMADPIVNPLILGLAGATRGYLPSNTRGYATGAGAGAMRGTGNLSRGGGMRGYTQVAG